jgi:hypothetical protein
MKLKILLGQWSEAVLTVVSRIRGIRVLDKFTTSNTLDNLLISPNLNLLSYLMDTPTVSTSLDVYED